MRSYLRLGAPLAVAAVAVFAVASAQGGKPPPAQLSFGSSSYTFDALPSGGRTHVFDLTFTGKGNTGPLSMSIVPDAGSSGLTITGDTCTGATLSAKTRQCSIDVNYAWNAPPGSDTATLTATARTLSASIQITGVSSRNNPTVNSQIVVASLDTAQTITLTGTDPDGNQLSFSVYDTPDHGSLGTISSPASCSVVTGLWTCTATVLYTPDTGFTGQDGFGFLANDGTANSDQGAAVTIYVTPSPDGVSPWANTFGAQYLTNEESTITLSGGDPNGDDLSFEIYEDPAFGVLGAMIDPAYCTADIPSACTANVTYLSNPGFEGTDTFTYRTYDGENYSDVATVTLNRS